MALVLSAAGRACSHKHTCQNCTRLMLGRLHFTYGFQETCDREGKGKFDFAIKRRQSGMREDANIHLQCHRTGDASLCLNDFLALKPVMSLYPILHTIGYTWTHMCIVGKFQIMLNRCKIHCQLIPNVCKREKQECNPPHGEYCLQDAVPITALLIH